MKPVNGTMYRVRSELVAQPGTQFIEVKTTTSRDRSRATSRSPCIRDDPRYAGLIGHAPCARCLPIGPEAV